MTPTGNEAFSVTQPAPPADELTQGRPHDGGQPIIYGSGAVLGSAGVVGYYTPPNPPEVTILAEDPGRIDRPHVPGLTRAYHSDNEPLLYGSGQTIAGDVNRAQYGSGQVVKEDPNVSNLGPGLLLPYGNNEVAPAGVTGTIVLAPQTGGASGAISTKQDPSVLIAPSLGLGAGTNDSITSSQPSSPQSSASQGNASGVSLLPSQKVDPNEGGQLEPGQALSQTGLAVSGTNPVAPASQSQPSGSVRKVQTQEGGGAQHTVIPQSQYGQSSP